MTEAKTIISSPQNIIKISNALDKISPVTLIQQGKLFKLSNFGSESNYIGSTTNEDKDKPQRQSIRRIFLSKVKKEVEDIPKVLINSNSSNHHHHHINNNNNNFNSNNNNILTLPENNMNGDVHDMLNSTSENSYQLNNSGSSNNNNNNNNGSIDSPTSAQTIIQYGNDGQFYIPVHQLNSNLVSLPQGLMMTPTCAVELSGGQDAIEEASRKRELRLLKNKEAAKECRRKKKEYVRCLENRVAVLENQNKTLIEELKSLKELYCQKDMHS